MMPPWCYAGRDLVGRGRCADEIVELLDQAGCLSSRGRAERSAMIALFDRTAQAFRPPTFDSNEPMYPGSDPPTLAKELVNAMSQAGYVDDGGWSALHDMHTYGTQIERAVAAVRADDVACWRCQQGLPSSANYCGYCGSLLGVPAAVGRA